LGDDDISGMTRSARGVSDPRNWAFLCFVRSDFPWRRCRQPLLSRARFPAGR
jgi:hypothetical protein